MANRFDVFVLFFVCPLFTLYLYAEPVLRTVDPNDPDYLGYPSTIAPVGSKGMSLYGIGMWTL